MNDRYDLIGDLHGHASALDLLLEKLGYQSHEGTYRHPEGRRVIFLGDYIDRGPEIPRTLEMVRGMVDSGNALAILGNHEINALRFHTRDRDGKPLRDHNGGNARQHQATLEQFEARGDWISWMDWFAGLPLHLDLGNVRAVHACWDEEALAEVGAVKRWAGETLETYSRKGTPAYETISRVINGPEALLPGCASHRTADGRIRREYRVKWWNDNSNRTCREAIFPEDDQIPQVPAVDLPRTGYPESAPPTFFGHYAVKQGDPAPIRSNLACLDYGAGKGGKLVAYRWDGESALDKAKFISVETA